MQVSGFPGAPGQLDARLSAKAHEFVVSGVQPRLGRADGQLSWQLHQHVRRF
jgi:hypothetical protein